MKFKYLLLAMIATMAFASCASVQKGAQSTTVMLRNVELDPIKADIEISQEEKLVGEASVRYILGFRIDGLKEQKMLEGIDYVGDFNNLHERSFWGGFKIFQRRKNFARSMAAYKAMESCPDCDVLVHPKYELTIKKSPLGIIYKKYNARVTAYGAKYKNFRTEKEVKILGSDNKEYIVIDSECCNE